MKKNNRADVVKTLIETYGCTYAQQLGIPVKTNSPEALFRLLVASLLFSTRISSRVAVRAADALTRRGWTTPEKLLKSTWQERVQALDEAHYVRYDESRASMLKEMAQQALELYGGDLRNLRDRAERLPQRERALLKDFKGIGDVGADIFFREAQVAWDELYPFADRRALEGARKLGLGANTEQLAALVDKKTFPHLVAALVRVQLEGDIREVLESSRQHAPA
ncbi:MAG: HhH-GDP family DNA glycosylase [Endomicrobiales bacterium]